MFCKTTVLFLLAVLSMGCSDIPVILKGNGDYYDIVDLLTDLGTFYPSAKMIMSQGLRVWSGLKTIEPYLTGRQVNPTVPKQLKRILESTDKISRQVEATQVMIREQVMNMLPKELNKDESIKYMLRNVRYVDRLFTRLLQNIDPERPPMSETMAAIINDIISHMENNIDEIYSTLMDFYGDKVFEVIADPKQSAALMCKRHQSSSHVINVLYNRYLTSEIKGIVMTLYAYSLKREPNAPLAYTTEVENYVTNVQNRVGNLMPKISEYMSSAPRELWACDPSRYTEGTTYVQLSPFFQKYIISPDHTMDKKGDRHHGFWNGLDNPCPSLQNVFLKNSDNLEKPCVGTIKDCSDIPLKSAGQYCKESKESERRYKYIKPFDNKEVYGDNSVSCEFEEENYASHSCLCNCYDEFNNTANRYFNLRDVTSDLDQNKVVTGLKIRQKNKMIHFQIQQGALIGNGNINQSTVDWKPIESYNVLNRGVKDRKDFFKVTYDNKTVNIDNLNAPDKTALTGVRFAVDDHALKIEIRYTPFDFDTGELHPEQSIWYSQTSADKKRLELKYGDELPTKVPNEYNPKDKGCVRFNTSSLTTDAGQTVIPFIDAQELAPVPATVLSGAGLIHRGSQTSGGFIALKLNTYNYGLHVDLDAVDKLTMDKFADTSLFLQFSEETRNKLLHNTGTVDQSAVTDKNG